MNLSDEEVDDDSLPWRDEKLNFNVEDFSIIAINLTRLSFSCWKTMLRINIFIDVHTVEIL